MKSSEALSEQEARQVFAYIIRRAVTDTAFRRALLQQPRETLEQEFAIALPDFFNIRFVENQGADLTIVLPDFKASFSEPDLEHVVGGRSPLFYLERRVRSGFRR